MIDDSQLTHQKIAGYIRGDLKKEDIKQTNDLTNKYANYELFFELIDKLRPQVSIKKEADNKESLNFSFKELEDLLLNFLSGNIGTQDAQRFMDALLFSPVFFRRLLIKINEASPELPKEELTEMPTVDIKSDETVVSEVVRLVKHKDEKEYPTSEQNSFWEKMSRFIDLPNRVPAYAILVFIFLLGGYFTYHKINEYRFYAQFVYDNEVPYDPDSGLRSGEEPALTNPQLQSFVRQCEIGIADYLARDYKKAIDVFESLKGRAESLQAEPLLPENGIFLRDFYFYLGVSHLALFTTRSLEIDDQERKQHLDNAESNLLQAQSLVKDHDLEEQDREIYFLGLAYGFADEKRKAVELLQKISGDSQFEVESLKLIQKWTNY